MSALTLLRRLALAGLLLCLTVVVLGAYVRLTAAGLGCPDWPGCYGHLTPVDGQHIELGKAWREMVHRYAASTLGLIIVVIAVVATVRRRQQPVPPGFAWALLATVVLQGLLGMLTVTLRLTPLIVTLHLVIGMSTLSLLAWLWLSLRGGIPSGAAPAALHWLAPLALAALLIQIALGGWTSANYAAIACPDFPTCQNRWWPDTDYANAFNLWRGLGLHYEGGVLAPAARIAIHLTHRLGAAVLTALLLSTAVLAVRAPAAAVIRRRGGLLIAALALQLALGIGMVVGGFPLALATAHNAGAALLLLALVALDQAVYAARRPARSANLAPP